MYLAPTGESTLVVRLPSPLIIIPPQIDGPLPPPFPRAKSLTCHVCDACNRPRPIQRHGYASPNKAEEGRKKDRERPTTETGIPPTPPLPVQIVFFLLVCSNMYQLYSLSRPSCPSQSYRHHANRFRQLLLKKRRRRREKKAPHTQTHARAHSRGEGN